MHASEALVQLLHRRKISQRRFAMTIGKDPRNLGQILKRNTECAQDWMDWLNLLGYEVHIYDKEVGTYVYPEVAYIQVDPVTEKIDGVQYQTGRSILQCKTTWIGGWRVELYKQYDGALFFVNRSTSGATHVTPCSEQEAEQLIAACS